MKLSEIAARLNLPVTSSLSHAPDRDPDLAGVTPIKAARPGTISYIEGAKFASYLTATAASALILPEDRDLQQQAGDRGIPWISAADPRLAFSRTIALFYQPFQPDPGVHPTAVIDPSVRLGARVSIGAHVVIQPNVTVGDDVCLHPNVVIYPAVTVGDRTVIHANAVIHERSHLGADCVIHSGAAIGAEGFGFTWANGAWEKVQQSGIVVLEDGVEVGCNAAIDRPSVGETRIGTNSKLDNMVHIAHNCQIGKSCALAAQVGLAGQVQVGDGAILGGQVGAANQTQVGAGVQAGAKAGLHGQIPPGSVVMGNPASPYRTFLKSSAIYNRLPDMQRTLKDLQRQVAALQAQLDSPPAP
jgi:UDP-3-O-[3-hydroxymyristoyl] glucosamine N-acyltransferase